MKLAPIRVLSYDIECQGRKGIFPEAKQDPVIQIASILTEHGRTTPIDRQIDVLDTCLPIIGARVKSHSDERELLKSWTKYVVECDPDIITGYNSNNFDMPYILDRAQVILILIFFEWMTEYSSTTIMLMIFSFYSMTEYLTNLMLLLI